MNNQKNTNICYVFSQATLELALSDWVGLMQDSTPKDSDHFLIVETSIPWLLKHLNQSSAIFMFSETDLNEGIGTWKEQQIADYPHQETLIEKTCDGIIQFFQSDIVSKYKMTVQA